jgi:hypothetical protein
LRRIAARSLIASIIPYVQGQRDSKVRQIHVHVHGADRNHLAVVANPRFTRFDQASEIADPMATGKKFALAVGLVGKLRAERDRSSG